MIREEKRSVARGIVYTYPKTELSVRANTENNRAETNKQFPIEVFPKTIQEFIKEATLRREMSIDYLGLAILTASATAIGNTHKVEEIIQVTPIIYAALIGNSSAGKSPVIKMVFNKLREKDDEYYSQYENELENYSLEMKAWKSASTKERLNMDKPIMPKLRQIGIDKCTPEALGEALKINKKSLVLDKDELIGMIKELRGGMEDDLIKIWDNESYKRNTKTAGFTSVKNAFLNIIGGIQPARLETFAKNNRNDSGFIFRFLFCYPESKRSFSDRPLDPIYLKKYEDVISKLLELELEICEGGGIRPTILKLSQKASIKYQAWRKEFRETTFEESDNTASIYTKLENYSLRFTLILQMLYWAGEEENKDQIGERAVEGAIKLTEFFRINALKVQDTLSSSSKKYYHPKSDEILSMLACDPNYKRIEEKLGVSSKTIAKVKLSNQKVEESGK